MRDWWKDLEPRFRIGVYVSIAWLVLGLGYAWLYYGWKPFWEMLPNSIGDFFAGLTAPLAFLWLVLGYIQQGSELKKTQAQVERQSLFMGRSAFIDLMKLMHADIQFSVLRMLEKAEKNLPIGPEQREAIKKSRTAYFEGGDKEAPIRRVIKLLSEDFDSMKFAIERDERAVLIAKKVVGDFPRLLKEASLVDGDNHAMRRYAEQSIYGELFNGLCLVLGEKPEFVARKAVDQPSDLAV